MSGTLTLSRITSGLWLTLRCWVASWQSRGIRFSVSFILSCLAQGMGPQEIEETYAPLPREAIPEIMKIASELHALDD